MFLIGRFSLEHHDGTARRVSVGLAQAVEHRGLRKRLQDLGRSGYAGTSRAPCCMVLKRFIFKRVSARVFTLERGAVKDHPAQPQSVRFHWHL